MFTKKSKITGYKLVKTNVFITCLFDFRTQLNFGILCAWFVAFLWLRVASLLSLCSYYLFLAVSGKLAGVKAGRVHLCRVAGNTV